ncbi:Wadjet anti-phage system protein JetD domain-containing protein [Nonomuraea sp. NPDC049709]|uniref:Wadjet anti-phage system protein JetD domain-containing protein n=1 Tax=Nonomuraea sp. NPDC049709 TaxID=3154736 RepID=UPI0034296678
MSSLKDSESLIRERIPLPGLPETLAAYVVYPEGRRPEDRQGRLNPREVEIVAAVAPKGFAPSEELSVEEVVWFLRESERRWSGMLTHWRDRASDLAFAVAACGGLVIIAKLDSRYRIKSITRARLTPAWAEVAKEKIAELTGRTTPEAIRGKLLMTLREVPELADEYALLIRQEAGAPLLPPVESRTRAGRWPPYEFALRAAAWLYSRPDPERKPPADEVASWAFTTGKASKESWTLPRRLAVENLMSRTLSELVTFPDYEIRVRGPLQWTIGSVAVDASVARPWAGLPSNGARLMGEIHFGGARGVFVVENQTTFQEVCKLPVTSEWIVVWGKGYGTHGLVDLLRLLVPLPIAVWGDLDAHGINIIADMEQRVGRPFHPVGMDASYWAEGKHRKIKESERTRGIAAAQRLASSGPEAFRDLARMIAAHPNWAGGSREQQTLHGTVLPLVPELLAVILR